MNVLIIEDELYTAKDLARTIMEVAPQAEIVEILPSVEESIEFLSASPEIDLIFSDIQLNDGLSFEIFQAVPQSIPIIFCTAFNQYALEAFKTHSIDYILKPFETETVQKALAKYQELKQRFAGAGTTRAESGREEMATSESGHSEGNRPGTITNQDLEAITEAIKARLFPAKKGTSIIVHKGEKFIPMPLEEIALFYIKNDLVRVYTFQQEKYVLNKKMDDLEAAYSPTFFRANRQQLIHRNAIRDADQYFHRKLLINLKVPFEDQILVSKLKVKPFLEWLSNH